MIREPHDKRLFTGNSEALSTVTELQTIPNTRIYPSLTLRDVLIVTFRYKTLIVSTFLATVLITFIALWMRDPAYETEARILIKYGRDAAGNPRASLSPGSARISQAPRPDINSDAELLKSYWLADKVVTELHLDQKTPKPVPPDLIPRLKYEIKILSGRINERLDELQYRLSLKEQITPRERAITEILENLKVEGVKDSSVVDVKLRTKFKEGASIILNRLIEHYREVRMSSERNPGVDNFFEGQSKDYGKRLRDSESALIALKSKAEIASLPEQMGLTSRVILDSQLALQDTGAKLAEARAQVDLLEKQVKGENPRVTLEEVAGRNAILDTLTERKTGLLIERQKLTAKVTDTDPRIADLDQQITQIIKLISDAEKEVERSRTTGENSVYVDLRKQLSAALRAREAAQARYQAQQQTLASLQERLRQLQTHEASYSQLSRDIELNSENYKLYQRNAVESKTADALNTAGITSISMIDPAVDPILPVGLRRVYIFAGALVGGLLLGLGLALLGETLSRAVNKPEHIIEHFGPPLLARVRFFSKKEGHLPPTGPALQDAFDLASRIEEAFGQDPGKVVITVLGANPGAGASTVSRLLAYALSAGGTRRTLLLCMANGSAKLVPNEIFETLSPGLTSANTLIPDSLTTEPVIPQSLVSNRGDYDRVILDVSSSVPRSKQLAIARSSDGVVVVVESERTRREVLQWLKAELQRVHAPIMGALLNKQRYHVPEFIYRWL